MWPSRRPRGRAGWQRTLRPATRPGSAPRSVTWWRAWRRRADRDRPRSPGRYPCIVSSFVELAHPIRDGMAASPGLPPAKVGAILTHEESRDRNEEKAEFLLGH